MIKKLTKIKLLVQRAIAKVSAQEYTLFSIYSIITGAIAGLAAVLFHNSIEFFNHIFFQQTASGLFFLGGAAVIVMPALGMFIQSMMIYFFPKTASKRGVSEVIKSVALRGGFIPFRTTLFHFIAPVISIGSGGTVGPEGPAAQLGGGVASKFGNLISLSDSRRRMFTAAGSGAAIAAIFNTPLGGIFFALEVILLNDFNSPAFSALILATVTASAISRILLGNVSVFEFGAISGIDYSHLYMYVFLGIGAGLISIAFIRFSSALDKVIKQKILTRIPQWVLMTLVGLLVGVVGYFYKEIFGIGYNAINDILGARISWHIVLLLLGFKFVLVPLTLNSGGFGGLFAPSLFMGACFGFLFAVLMESVFYLPVNYTLFVLVGMGAVLGGVNSIPISAILIIFEMTKEYAFILPLMLAVVISTTLVQIFLKGSVHLKHLEQEGYSISHGRETSILRSILVDEIMNKDYVLIKENTNLSNLVSKIMESPSSTFYIVDESLSLRGIISGSEIRPIISEYEHVRDVLVASDIANKHFTTVKADDDLDYVLKLFGKENLDELPVIDSTDSSKIIGSISRNDIIEAYNKESLKFNLADGFAGELKTIDKYKSSRVAEGYSIVERKISDSFIGKTLSQLRIRNKFGVEVLMIKKKQSFLADDSRKESELIVPDPDYIIQSDDTLVIFGSDDKLEKTANW